MKHVRDFNSFLDESMRDGNTAEVQGPTFSIHDKKPGDTVKVEGEDVEIVEFNTWVKDHEAACLSFTCKRNGEKHAVRYDDSVDGYVFVNKNDE